MMILYSTQNILAVVPHYSKSSVNRTYEFRMPDKSDSFRVLDTYLRIGLKCGIYSNCPDSIGMNIVIQSKIWFIASYLAQVWTMSSQNRLPVSHVSPEPPLVQGKRNATTHWLIIFFNDKETQWEVKLILKFNNSLDSCAPDATRNLFTQN